MYTTLHFSFSFHTRIWSTLNTIACTVVHSGYWLSIILFFDYKIYFINLYTILFIFTFKITGIKL